MLSEALPHPLGVISTQAAFERRVLSVFGIHAGVRREWIQVDVGKRGEQLSFITDCLDLETPGPERARSAFISVGHLGDPLLEFLHELADAQQFLSCGLDYLSVIRELFGVSLGRFNGLKIAIAYRMQFKPSFNDLLVRPAFSLLDIHPQQQVHVIIHQCKSGHLNRCDFCERFQSL